MMLKLPGPAAVPASSAPPPPPALPSSMAGGDAPAFLDQLAQWLGAALPGPPAATPVDTGADRVTAVGRKDPPPGEAVLAWLDGVLARQALPGVALADAGPRPGLPGAAADAGADADAAFEASGLPAANLPVMVAGIVPAATDRPRAEPPAADPASPGIGVLRMMADSRMGGATGSMRPAPTPIPASLLLSAVRQATAASPDATAATWINTGAVAGPDGATGASAPPATLSRDLVAGATVGPLQPANGQTAATTPATWAAPILRLPPEPTANTSSNPGLPVTDGPGPGSAADVVPFDVLPSGIEPHPDTRPLAATRGDAVASLSMLEAGARSGAAMMDRPSVAPATPVLDLRLPQAPQQLAEIVLLQVGQGAQEMRIRLHPQELGTLDIQFRLEGDRLSLRFDLADESVRDVVQTSLPQLSTQLAARGLSLEHAQVFAQDRGGAFQNPQQSSAQAQSDGSSSGTAGNPREREADPVSSPPAHRRVLRSGGVDDYA